jgi:hypothetical protein
MLSNSPVLKVANTLIKVAAIVGKAAGYPIPVDKLPFIDDIKDTALWTSLDRWYEHAGGQASGPPAVAASSQSAVAASAKSASSPPSAFHDAYVACRQLLEANDIATSNRHEPLGGLHRVQATNGGVRWVCQGHAERCFPDGHEIDAPLPASLGSPAANGGASNHPSSSLAQQLESVKAEAAQQEAQLKADAGRREAQLEAEAAQLKVEATRREEEAAQREASLRAENEQLQRRLAGVNPAALAATAAPSLEHWMNFIVDENESAQSQPCPLDGHTTKRRRTRRSTGTQRRKSGGARTQAAQRRDTKQSRAGATGGSSSRPSSSSPPSFTATAAATDTFR